MNTRFLEAFIWVVRLGSFRAAADRLNVTQAAISSRIAALEEDFGQRLFDREAKDVRPTAAGRLLLGHADALLSTEQRLRSAMQSEACLAGHIRLGTVETILHTWLIDLLRSVRASHPALEIELTSEPTQRLHEHLRRGTLDVILQSDPVLGDNIRNHDLGAMPMGWIGPAAADTRGPRTLAEVLAGAVITMTRGSQPHAALLQVCEQTGLKPPTVHCISSVDAIVRLVEAGLGLALIPRAAVREHVAAKRLRDIDVSGSLPSQRLVASYTVDPTNRALSRTVELACAEASRYALRVGADLARPAEN